jgi:hypothetical protein
MRDSAQLTRAQIFYFLSQRQSNPTAGVGNQPFHDADPVSLPRCMARDSPSGAHGFCFHR